MGVITQRGSILNSFALAAKASQPQQDVIQQHQEAKRTEHEIVTHSIVGFDTKECDDNIVYQFYVAAFA